MASEPGDRAIDGFAWVPGEFEVSRSRLLAAQRKWGLATTSELLTRSVADPEWFWRAATEDLEVEFSTAFGRAVDLDGGLAFPKWFEGGRINAAELCAHRHARTALSGKLAVVYEGDGGQRRTLTYGELDDQVRRFAAQLIGLGVGRRDRVVLFLPVVPEAVVAFLACGMIGAISVPAFSGYGVEALAMRIRVSGAAVLITADGTTRRGRRVPLKDTADEALASAPSVSKVVVVRHLGDAVPMSPGRDVYWDELEPDPVPVETVPMEPNEPLTIVYTSGTTGAPKGIVQSHGGFLAKSAVDFAYGFDVHPSDVVAWTADLGWLLGPLLILGVLQLGATAVMTEGVPDYPTPLRIFEIIERNGVTMQGIAPTAARALLAAGHKVSSDLTTLRAFASTGEAWDERTWWWLFENIGEGRRPIINYSGGTEIGGGVLIAYPFLPMQAAAFNGPLPGFDPAVFDEHGKAVVGAIGELVIRNASPGMTHAFWQDRERYLETYWSRWEGVWQHGDLASVDASGTWRIHGRSDDTIKVSGRRVGPAEIETAILKDQRVAEAAAIGVPDEMKGQQVVAFVVLRPGAEDADGDDLQSTAISNVGRSFAPTLHVVEALPKTKNGKIMRRAIRSRFLGTPAGDMSSLDPATPLEAIPVSAPKE